MAGVDPAAAPRPRKRLSLYADERGSLDAVAYVLMVTIIGIGLSCALTTIRDQLGMIFGDTADAMSTVNQSYTVTMTFAQIGGGTTTKTFGYAGTAPPVTVVGNEPAGMDIGGAPTSE